MNTERFIEGAGSSPMSTYVWEIALILGVAFLLGYLLRYLLNGGLNARITELEDANAKLYNSSKDVEQFSSDKEQLEIKLGEQKAEMDRLNTRLSDCFATRIKAENQLAVLQTKYDALSAKQIVEEPKTEVMSGVAASSIDSTISKSTDKDDLKKIEGVGPKIEQLLNADGINTFNDVVNATVERIKGILTAAGPNYAVHDPATWAEQSRLAASGNWDELAKLQEELKGGKRK